MSKFFAKILKNLEESTWIYQPYRLFFSWFYAKDATKLWGEVSSAQEELNELDDTIENNPKLLSRLQKDIEDRQTGKTKDQPYDDICL